MSVKEERVAIWVEVALEDYKAQRADELARQQSAQTTLAFGATTVGILAAGAFNIWDERLLVSIIFLAVVPLISVAVLVQWAGQMVGIMRLDGYLKGLEKAIRDAHEPVPKPVLTWWTEELFGRPSEKAWVPDYRWHKHAAITVFGLFSAGSIILGAYRGFAGHGAAIVAIAIIEEVLLAVVALLLTWEVATEPRRVDQRLHSE